MPMYALDSFRRVGGETFTVRVAGCAQTPAGGTCEYFLSVVRRRHGVPMWRVQYCDGGGDLTRAGLHSCQTPWRWEVIADGVTLQRARRAVQEHFSSTFAELNRRIQ